MGGRTINAGIATQIVVERQLEWMADVRMLSREKFTSGFGEVEAAIRRKHHRPSAARCSANGNTLTRRPSRWILTMDTKMSRAVIEVFVRLHDRA